jgi:serine/threonine protein kinase
VNGRVTGPVIPGLVFVRWLGSGGFGDVHLYENLTLGRQEAVKVIREADPNGVFARRCRAEAQAMAALTHQHIVRVFTTGETGDGRPFLTMQYYPGGTMERESEGGTLPIARVLRTGVEIGSALETSHRAGILHRDIKPANILVDEYGVVVLTDFGVAAEMASDSPDEEVGVSIPWSPPEMIYSDTRGSVQSDVYSLGATLWHLVVGRSPFAVPGGDNSRLAMMNRVNTFPPPLTGRADCPGSLDTLLRSMLAKEPEQRPRSVADVVRSLQLIEQERHLPPTRALIREPDGAPPVPPAPGGRTEPSTVIRPRLDDPSARGRPARPSFDGRAGFGRGWPQPSPAPTPPRPLGVTQLRPAQEVTIAPGADPALRGPAKLALILAGAGLLLAAAVVAFTLLGQGSPPSPRPSAAQSDAPPVEQEAPPPGPVTVTVARLGGKVVFTWSYDQALTTDTYRLRFGGGNDSTATEPKVEVAAPETGNVCLSVIVVRADGSNPTRTFPAPTCG